jgi:hypothetical protein
MCDNPAAVAFLSYFLHPIAFGYFINIAESILCSSSFEIGNPLLTILLQNDIVILFLLVHGQCNQSTSHYHYNMLVLVAYSHL